MNFVAIDLDGTLCDHSARKHFALTKQWKEFHNQCIYDKPYDDVLSYVKMIGDSRLLVVFVTGRPEEFREVTEQWLGEHLPDKFEYRLLMRPDGDFRSDYVLKLGLLQEYCGGREKVLSNILHAIDDRESVVHAFREYGIHCWQARPGTY